MRGFVAESSNDLSLQLLQVEMARIDLLVRRDVLRWQLAGQVTDDKFRGLHLTDAQVNALLDRPLATSWGQLVKLAPDERDSDRKTPGERQDVARTARFGRRDARIAVRQGRDARDDPPYSVDSSGDAAVAV